MGQIDYVDYLTGLHNRQGVHEFLEGLSENEVIHYMFLDIDNFKTVNDVYGHQAGDETLVIFSRILRECMKDALIARMGGDEFVIVLTGKREKQELSDIAGTIIRRVRQQGKEQVYLSLITVSIGIVRNFSGGEKRDMLMFDSDCAMYEAKRRGKDCYVFFEEIEEQVKQEREMGQQAKDAMNPRQFQFYFQGLMNLQNSLVEQTVVVVEWSAKNNTVWKSREYRPLMEKLGIIRQVDLIIFKKLCQEIAPYRKNSVNYKTICIELTHLLFLDDNLGDMLIDIMSPYGLAPRDFDLGIDESAFSRRDAYKLLANLNRLVEEGFHLTLCHFGKDFSCFRYLRDLPVRSIQFDHSFLKENLGNHRGRKIIKSMVRLGKDLKMLVSAAGVAEKKEVEYLNEYGCNAAYGEFYNLPMKLEDYIGFVGKIMADHKSYVAYPFIRDLCTDGGSLPGKPEGDRITFGRGINDMWGAIYFPGGDVGREVVVLPGELFASDSYTVSMWVKMESVVPWGSIVYMRYAGGFASLIPNAGDGISIFRINEDENVDIWHDVLCRSVEKGKWNMLTVTYNAYSETSVYYINGRKAGKRLNVPVLSACRQVILGGDPFQKSFHGWISAFMVFESVKTAEEIEKLYQDFLCEPGFVGSIEEYWMDKD